MDMTLPTTPTAALPGLFVIILVITALGFRKVVYFVSIGYAFSIAALALAVLDITHGGANALGLVHNLLLALWGLRVGIYLIWRERKASYQDKNLETETDYGGLRLGRKLLIWAGVATLYLGMYLPGLFTAFAPANRLPSALFLPVLGLSAMLAGLVIEAVADWQKSAFKARFPGSFCNIGLYRWVRCPNYLGEILFWVGNWITGILYYPRLITVLIALAAAICLTLIMLGSTRRLERDQERRYSHLPEFQTYIQTVPILIPFVPLYTLKNIRLYLE